MKEIYHVAQIGAFDFQSFGDTMFPVVFKMEMERRFGEMIQIDLYSPNGMDHPYNHLPKVHAIDELEEQHMKNKYDCIVIGGGEFIHFLPIEYYNSDGEKKEYSIGALWKKPQELATKLGVPTVWNCVGVSRNFGDAEEIEQIRETARKASYISVRDTYSKKRLQNTAGIENVQLCADMLWMFRRCFTKKQLQNEWMQLAEKNLFLRNKYLVLQYGTTYQLEDIAEQIEKLGQEHKWNVVLLVLNYCHEDQKAVNQIKEKYSQFHILEKKLQPIEIMAIIAGAEFFLGTSLHGNLTAMSYDVPNICLDMYPEFVSKMDGMFEMMGKEDRVIGQSQSIIHKARQILENEHTQQKEIDKKIVDIEKKLKKNFDDIEQIIRGTEKEIVLKESEKNYALFKIRISNNVEEQIHCIDTNGTFCLITNMKNVDGNFQIEITEGSAFYLNDLQIKVNGLKAMTESDSKAEEGLYEKKCVITFTVQNESENICLEIKGYVQCGKKAEYAVEKRKERLLEEKQQRLETENKRLNGHVELLLESERNLKAMIEGLETEKAEVETTLVNKEGHIELLLQSERDLQNEVANLKQEVLNKEGHINLLLESDRELASIKNSRSWRMTLHVANLSRAIFPLGSRRRLIMKMAARLVRHPVQSLHMLSPRKIRHFFYYLKEEGPGFVAKRIDESMKGVKVDGIELELQQPIEEGKDFSEYEKIVLPKENTPQVSIVIPVYNQFEYTYNCLKSISENTEGVTYEILIANDCSTDNTTRIEEVVENITVITNEENLRFLKNCNHAAEFARGQYILFLNNDTQVQKNWLKPLVDLIESEDEIGMVGSKLVYADGTLQEAGGIIWNDASAWNYGNRCDPTDPEYNYVKEVDYISGAAIMIRTSLWKEIGGFDELFAPAYYEDTDLACEVRAHGYKVMYQPLSVVVHFEGVSNGTDVNAGQKAYQVANQKKFYEKWKNVLEKENFANAQNVFLAKDRGQMKKKTLLFVDHYVPMYDKDAGSRCMFYYLKLFVKMGYNIKFIGDNFFKHEPYTTTLQQMGIEVLYGNYYFSNWKSWIVSNGKYFDYAFLSRPHISVKYIDLVRANSKAKIIYFGHDLHYLREMREYELNGNEQCLKDSREWKRKEMSLMRKADISYYLSNVELEEIAKVDPNIRVRRVPINIYDEFPKLEYKAEQRQDILFVGGFGHPPNTDAVTWLGETIMPAIWEKNPNIVLHVVGSKPPKEIQAFNSERMIIHGFVSDEDLEEMYRNIKLALVPLRYGAGIKGKIIEAMMRGIPMVTTSIGIEGIDGAEKIAKVSDDATELANTVADLYNDTAQLEKMAQEEHRYIEENYSVENAVKILGEDFEF